MPVKIRLQRKGKKGKPFYYIVAADSKTKRDGKFIERLGSYNPNTNPAVIDLTFDRALHWLKVGAQPTDTARAILSYKGILYKNHLDKGVLKGALSEDQANAKFQKWLEEKEAKIQGKKDNLASQSSKDKVAKLAAEKEVSDKRAAEIAAKQTPPTPEVEEATTSTEEVAEAAATETEHVGETQEEVTAEKIEETAAAETTEESAASENAEEDKKEDKA